MEDVENETADYKPPQGEDIANFSFKADTPYKTLLLQQASDKVKSSSTFLKDWKDAAVKNVFCSLVWQF